MLQRIASAQAIEEFISPLALKTICDWVLDQTKRIN